MENQTNGVNTMDNQTVDNGAVNGTAENSQQQPDDKATKTYTEEEVMKLIQAEADRRTNQALNKQKKAYEQKISLAKLDGDEREKAEKDNRIAELQEVIAQMNVEKNKSELKSVLSTRGLSAEFADIIDISDDIEASQANIDTLDRLFKAAVKAEVEKRLAGATPKGNGATGGILTKEEFNKMSLVEQNALYKKNPDLYKRLAL